MRVPILCSVFAFCLAVSVVQETDAQIYRGKVVQVVIGSPVGSNSDLLGRPIAQKLGEETGGVFLVNNRPGATGIIANELVAKSAPDGYTLLIAPSSFITSVPHLHLKMPYDSLGDLVPIVQLGASPSVLVSHPSVPIKTVADLIRVAKARPNLLTFGSGGVGDAFHLSSELFKQMGGVEMLHVPYRGITIALTDLVGGRIDLLFATYVIIRPLVGKLRIIAVTSIARDPLLPDIPTIDESGLRGYEMTNWVGMFAPKSTAPVVVEYLNKTIHNILMTPELRTMWKNQGVQFKPNIPKEFSIIVQNSYTRYGKLIATVGIKPE